MSSFNSSNPFYNSVSEKQFNGFYIPDYNAKIIKESIENGTAPFLPDKNGNVNAKPIINGNTGYCLNAKDLIPMQIIKNDNSDIAVTYKTTQNLGTRIKEGERGFFYNFQREDKTVGTSQFFFPEQTKNPELIKEKIAQKVAKTGIKKLDKTLEITSSNPEEYLGTYIAACKYEANLKVNPQIAEEFKQKFTVILNNQLTKKEERNAEIDTLSKFMFKADQKANSISKELSEKSEIHKENHKQFKPKQNNRKPIELEH